MSNKKQWKSFKNWKIKGQSSGQGEEKSILLLSVQNVCDVYYLPVEDACLYFLWSTVQEKGK